MTRKLTAEGSDSSGSPMIRPVSAFGDQKKSSESFGTQDDTHIGSDSGSGPVVNLNPEVISLGSVSVDSNSLGLLSSEKDSGKAEEIFGGRESLTPSPTDGAEGVLDEFDEEDEGDVDLTPRDGNEMNGTDGSEHIWMIVWKRILGCLGNVNGMCSTRYRK